MRTAAGAWLPAGADGSAVVATTASSIEVRVEALGRGGVLVAALGSEEAPHVIRLDGAPSRDGVPGLEPRRDVAVADVPARSDETALHWGLALGIGALVVGGVVAALVLAVPGERDQVLVGPMVAD